MTKLTKLTSLDAMCYYMNSPFRYTFNDGEVIFGYVDYVTSEKEFLIIRPSWIKTKEGEIRKPIKDIDDWYEIGDFKKDGEFELILYHPCDLSKGMNGIYKTLCYKVFDLKDNKKILRYADTPRSLVYLFENSIDAFDLIDNGYALDIKDFEFIEKEIIIY